MFQACLYEVRKICSIKITFKSLTIIWFCSRHTKAKPWQSKSAPFFSKQQVVKCLKHPNKGHPQNHTLDYPTSYPPSKTKCRAQEEKKKEIVKLRLGIKSIKVCIIIPNQIDQEGSSLNAFFIN